LAPENTLVAYEKALELGAIAAETDLHLSGDHHVILMHDSDLNRTTSGVGEVSDKTLEELGALDAGGWFGEEFAGEPVATLAALLELAHGRMALCLEIKGGLGIEHRIRDLVDARDQRTEVVMFSFEADKIALAKALMPDVPALYLATGEGEPCRYSPDVVDDAVRIEVDALGFDHVSLERELVDAAHQAGLVVFVYTVNSESDARRAVALGVDGIISDVPGRISAWLDGQHK